MTKDVKTPNILLIHTHDLGRFLGCYGVETVRTPNIDRLASESVQFNQAFSMSPVCSPARATLYTGRSPHSTGVLGLTHRENDWDMHPDEKHLALRLKEVGYTTSMVGIFHEAGVFENSVACERFGFDQYTRGSVATKTTELACSELERFAENDSPFYMQVGYFEPHRAARPQADKTYMGFLGRHVPEGDCYERPVTIPPYIKDDEGGRAEMAEIQAAIEYLDSHVGQVLQRLEETGQRDNTIILFTTDHGLALPRSKRCLYDPGCEVSLFICAPERFSINKRKVDALVSHQDVVPTLLDMIDAEIAPEIQGKNLVPLLNGDVEKVREHVFMEFNDASSVRAIRTERYKFMVHFDRVAGGFYDSSQSWKPRSSPVFPEEPGRAGNPIFELYDLENDPQEFNNLAKEENLQSVKNDLSAKLKEWMVATDDPILKGPIASPFYKAVMAQF